VRAASVVLLPCVPSSVAVARGQIAAELRAAGLPATAVADAALVTSELLSNAILHARPLPDARIRVAWILSPSTVEVVVSDGGSTTRPRASRPSLSSIGGRGLGIVEHLASSWGVRADDRGSNVWAVLPAPRDGAAGPRGRGPAGPRGRGPGGAATAGGRPAGGRPAGGEVDGQIDGVATGRSRRMVQAAPSMARDGSHGAMDTSGDH